jgi:heat shock protein HtpX
MNTLKVGILLVALTALFVLIGQLVGGTSGALIALVLAAVLNLGSYWFSDKLVLSMTGAKPISESEAPELYAIVARLAQRAGIPKPRLYVVEQESPNAFATGRNPEHGVVAVTTGLLKILDQPEVEGVIAHEISHIKHRDTLTMAIVATVAGAIMFLANMLRFTAIFGGNSRDGGNALTAIAVSIFAPIAAIFVQMAVSRSREFEADRLGAEIAGSPRGLASALDKLDTTVRALPTAAPPQAAHMFIVNPFSGVGPSLLKLFSSHPPTKERIQRLMAMERS